MLYLHLTCDCVWNYCFGSTKPPHQLSIIGILILHKSKPANTSKQHLCLVVEYPNDNKRFYRAKKILEKNGVDNLIGVARLSVESVALRVPLRCHWSALEKSCALQCIVALPREDAGVPHLV